MFVYEIGYLLVPKVSEEKLPEESAAVRTLVEKHGGSVLSEEFPVLRELSYTMEKSAEARKEKYDEAFFGSIKFEMPTSNISALGSEFSKSKNILRHIIVKTIKGNTMFSDRQPNPKRASIESGDDTQNTDSTSEISEAPEKAEKQPVSQEDIDKSIDALVIS